MNKLILLMTISVISFGIISELRAADSYTYDDNGRLSEFVWHDSYAGTQNISINYGHDGETIESIFQKGPYSTKRQMDITTNTDDSGNVVSYLATSDNGNYAAIFDTNGRIIQDGVYMPSMASPDAPGPWHTSYTYEYDDETGQRISRTKYNCGYIHIPTTCTSSSTLYYDYDYDDLGNVVAEYLVPTEGAKHSDSDQPVATRDYTDTYLTNQKAQKDAQCTTSGNCTNCYNGLLQSGKCVSSCGESFRLNDGECDRIRYTPAEAAQYLKDTDNTIIMTFKVNR